MIRRYAVTAASNVSPDSPIEVPGLATIEINPAASDGHIVRIVLADSYVNGPLNDIAETTPGPDNVFLELDDTSALNSPALAKFMEVLSHWDIDGDRKPDFAHIAKAIDDALWRADDMPRVFTRPNKGWFTKAVMAMMPPQPEHQIVYSFGRLRRLYSLRHYVGGAVMLVLFFGIMNGMFYIAPFSKYSVISGYAAAMLALGVNEYLALGSMILLLVVYFRYAKQDAPLVSPHTIGFFNKAAVWEEQAFREGAEDWSLRQRFNSCLAFGLIHLANLFYPLATVVPLTIGGAALMYIYLRKLDEVGFRRIAVLEASVWHRVYNRMAIIVIIVTLPLLLGFSLITSIMSFAFMLIAAVAFLYIDDHVDFSQKLRRSTEEVVVK